jgi:hypothetical protein
VTFDTSYFVFVMLEKVNGVEKCDKLKNIHSFCSIFYFLH